MTYPSKTDVEKLRLLADWFDIMQDLDMADYVERVKKFSEWSDSREVQQDLRRIADDLDYYYTNPKESDEYDDGTMRMGI